jgi:hypothetical protein
MALVKTTHRLVPVVIRLVGVSYQLEIYLLDLFIQYRYITADNDLNDRWERNKARKDEGLRIHNQKFHLG